MTTISIQNKESMLGSRAEKEKLNEVASQHQEENFDKTLLRMIKTPAAQLIIQPPLSVLISQPR